MPRSRIKAHPLAHQRRQATESVAHGDGRLEEVGEDRGRQADHGPVARKGLSRKRTSGVSSGKRNWQPLGKTSVQASWEAAVGVVRTGSIRGATALLEVSVLGGLGDVVGAAVLG